MPISIDSSRFRVDCVLIMASCFLVANKSHGRVASVNKFNHIAAEEVYRVPLT